MSTRSGGRWAALFVLTATVVLLGSSGAIPGAHPTSLPLRGIGSSGTTSALHATTPTPTALAAATLAGAPALAVPSWINVTRTGPNASPPGVYWGSLAYDAADQEVVAFGGCDSSVCPQNYTWVFSQGVWTNITNPHDAPPARITATMDYDPNMNGVLLFGGVGASGYLNDTWLFSGGSWTNLSWVGPAPPARIFASMAFDPDPEVNGSVVWGGYSLSLGTLNDTWAWQAWAGWVHLNTTVLPPAADGASLAYDPADSALVLYGAGFTSSTWELQGGQWWPVHTAGPPYRQGAGMVFVPGASAVFLFGGANSTYLNDSWSFSGGVWSNDTSGLVSAPPARAFAGLTLDPSGSVPLLFGGTGASTYMNDTWAIATLPSATLAATPGTTEVAANVTFTATMSGGIPPYLATFHFADNVTDEVSGSGPTLVATHAFVNPGTYTAWVNVTDSVGLTANAVASATPVSVSAGPAIAATATPSSVDVGQSVSFSVTAASGVPPITYQWTFGDGTSSSGTTASHAYATPGTYPVAVVGTDAEGVHANASLSVVVVPLPTLAVADNRSSATVNEPVTFYANVSGGTAPYRFAWSFGDGSRSAFPSPFHVFTTAGNYTVQVWTNDSFSVTNHESLVVSIHSASSSPPSNNSTGTKAASTGVPNWFYPGLGGLVGVGVIGCALIAWRARSHRSS